MSIFYTFSIAVLVSGLGIRPWPNERAPHTLFASSNTKQKPTVISPKKKIHRSCSAEYEWEAVGRSAGFGRFNARGGCGSVKPNACRSRARDRAHSCMMQHGRTQNGVIPQACFPPASVYSYYTTAAWRPVLEAQRRAKRSVCPPPKADHPLGGATVEVKLFSKTWGDKNCDARREVMTTSIVCD